MNIVIASRNPGKIREIRHALTMPGVKLLSADELPGWPEPEETGSTFEENAVIKASELCRRFDEAALADDSGLVVDALGGEPGVLSSRYAGPEGDAERNIERLLREMETVPEGKRTARFICVIALVFPSGETLITDGVCEGEILTSRSGSGGFGYDPVFAPAGFTHSMAELTIEEKNRISHRGRALEAMRRELSGRPGD